MKSWGIVIAIVVLIVGAIWWEWSIWQECRLTNSIGYCLRLISR